MSSSDTFQIVTHPTQPGICRTCGGPFGIRRMVDTGLSGDFCNRPHWNNHTQEVETENDINMAGSVYLCESCIVNMGMAVGMLPEYKVKALREEMAHLEDELEQQTQRNLGLEKIVDGYRVVSVSDLTGSIGGPTPAELNAQEGSEANAVRGLVLAEGLHGANSGESSASESISDEEHTGVSRDDSNEPGKRGDESTGPTTISGADSGRLGF